MRAIDIAVTAVASSLVFIGQTVVPRWFTGWYLGGIIGVILIAITILIPLCSSPVRNYKKNGKIGGAPL